VLGIAEDLAREIAENFGHGEHIPIMERHAISLP